MVEITANAATWGLGKCRVCRPIERTGANHGRREPQVGPPLAAPPPLLLGLSLRPLGRLGPGPRPRPVVLPLAPPLVTTSLTTTECAKSPVPNAPGTFAGSCSTSTSEKHFPRVRNLRVVRTARKWLFDTAAREVAGEDITADLAATKLVVSEQNLASATAAVQLFGGNGYMTDFGLEKELRDAVGGTIYSGTSQIQRNRIASAIGL
ncbi:hypothetical protein INP57_20025 [Saccharopolyspora sp. HNM0986]|nr:hypothetical protein [Saccharopolyspora sp. HNM0986]